MLALAPLVAVAATPLANTACDPAPEPYCTNTDRTTWLESVTAEAAWQAGSVPAAVVLTLSRLGPYPFSFESTFTVVGGSLISTETTSDGYRLTLGPDAGVTELRVNGQLLCEAATAALTVTLELSASPDAGTAIPTTVQ